MGGCPSPAKLSYLRSDPTLPTVFFILHFQDSAHLKMFPK